MTGVVVNADGSVTIISVGIQGPQGPKGDPGGSAGTYTNLTPMPQSLGGLDAGTTFDNTDITSLLDGLLYPYVAINATSLSGSIGNSLRERGNTISGPITFTANYTLGTDPLTDITFKRDGVVQQTGLSNTWVESFNVTTNTTFRAEVSDGTTTDSVQRSYSFVYPFYWGTGAPGLTPAEIRSNFGAQVTNNGDKIVSMVPSNEVYYFAYPASYGALNRVLDWNNFDITSDFTIRVENLVGLDGSSQSYRIYEFNNLVSHSAQNITFDT